MSRRWLLFLVCLGCALFSLSQVSQITSARFEVSVDEAATRIFFKELAPEVALVVKNGSSESIRSVVRIELLEPDNTITGKTERKVDLKSGTQKLPFTLPVKTRELTPEEDDEILWYRLHYRITPESSSSSNQTIEGFISLSEITPDLFELRVMAPKSALAGKPYTVRVRAAHPFNRRPFKNVEVKGLITLDNDEDQDVSLTSSAITDSEGIADLTFTIPTNVDSSEDDFELNIEGRLGLVTVKAERDIEISNRPSLVVSTDKPLYQPGQTVFARLLMLGPSKRAIANEEIDVEITDPEGTTVFSSVLKTSRFGIASIEWPIPDSTRLGDYRLSFENSDDDDQRGEATVKISRYDLPTFAVNVKPDRPYYLAGQNAMIDVRADYLFGKPVTKGHVRVVRETERDWNYREQKYETVEGDKYEGDTQADGVFKAQIPLSEDHSKLIGEDYNRFTDLRYAAYFTDASTNRTEQRRFNIRLTKEAIHIYIIHGRNSYYSPRNLPLKFYVSTCYADGTPVSSDLTVRSGDTEDQATMKVLRQVRTNRYGLVSLDQFRLSQEELEESRVNLKFVAQDKRGNTGKHGETFSLRDAPAVRVSTSKPLLASGEPIEATITSTEPALPITLIITRDRLVVHSQEVKLQNGRASVLIPYKKEFKDELTISAFAESFDTDGDEELIRGIHTVLYPRKRDLNLNLVSASQTYKPGENAHVKFHSISPEGKGIESALGVVVTDRAVDERVRTDQEFGSRYSGFYSSIYSLIGYGESIGDVSRKSLEQLDMAKPVSKDLALAAEIILNQGYEDYAMTFGGYGYEREPAPVFVPILERELTNLTETLKNIYANHRVYPKNQRDLHRLLSTAGINFSALKDPWGTPYRSIFLTEYQSDTFSLRSAGADKRFDTEDDFSFCRLTWSYFKPAGEVIDAAVKEYHSATGDYIRNLESLRTELSKRNLNLDGLRDPWNQSYNFVFEPLGRFYEIRVSTRQPASGKDREVPQEFTVWQSRVDYFDKHRARIDTELAKQFREKGSWPANENEMHTALTQSGIETRNLRDPWGHSYYFNFQTSAFYGDRVQIESRSNFGQASNQKVQLTPVTKKMSTIKIRSAGPDAQEGTYDDFELATFGVTVSEQSASDDKPKAPQSNVSFSGSKGAIAGTITDSQGAVVAGVRVTAKLQGTEEVFEAESDENGKYLLRNLPAGIYELRTVSAGFMTTVISQVVVRSSGLVEVNLSLSVASVSETVSIVADGVNTLDMTSASVTTTRVQNKLVFLAPGVAAAKQQLSTPRLREYFPETLLWQPQLTTDKKGRAQLDFKLADNITTWRMSVIGSTEDGEIGTAETEIRAFQPFFAELDPPRVLTEGDRISLPVVLRNYLDKKQWVDLTLKPESWFKVMDSNQKRSQVSAGDSQNEVFNLQAIASTKDGKQRVTAIGSDFSDAIEKPVSVHPDGEEKAETVSDLLDAATTLSVNLPDNTIANSAQVEVKVYPNLMTHVWESVEGIMKRPYGCGEQTISSTYPSLLVARYLKNEKLDSPMAAKAKKYLSEGYQRLLSYQSSSGGFTYWGNGEPDIALTAYAIRFLHDAASVTTVDSSVEQRAGRWLLSQQQSDGRWAAMNWNKQEDLRRTTMLTALVARSLVLAKLPPTTPTVTLQTEKSALQKALDYVEAQAAGIDEPYLIASYSLASSLAGEKVRAERANTRLKSLAHSEGPRTYWTLETNTPFYGWGLAGRIETTALAVQALAKGTNQTDQERRTLQTRGLLFLLHNQDRYGVWYSTQATINVLDAMLSLMTENVSTRQSGSPGVDVIVNGQTVRTVVLPTDKRMTAPLLVDVSSNIRMGKNQIEFRKANGGSPVSLQVVNTYYIPWKTKEEIGRVRSGDSESLKLETRFDKVSARVTEEITCYVKAERIGFRGYGMMLAEIGLPPGADVDRASLETAVKGSDWSISQYDILPDRVVLYLWPRAGGSQFSFKFRPRMAMTAKAAASTVYDYYNPEARAVVAPGTFVVR